MIDHAMLRALHVGAVYLSGTLFLLRGLGMLAGHDWYRRGIWRVLPHLVDSVLLGAAVGLLLVLSGYPLGEPWLLSKLSALALYIALGSVALRHGATRRSRVTSFFAALAVFSYIVGVAISRSPTWGMLGG